MTQYFSVRDAPANKDGKVIAIWKKEQPQFHLSLLSSDPKHEVTVNAHLIEEVDEYDFDVMDAIAEIPHIQSDGIHHYLGEVDYTYPEGFQIHPAAPPVLQVQCKLYAVVTDLDNIPKMRFLAGACAFEVNPEIGDKYDGVCVAEALPEDDPLLDIYK